MRKFAEFLAEMDGGGTGAGAAGGGTMSTSVAPYPVRLFSSSPVQRNWPNTVSTGQSGTSKRKKKRY